MPKFERIEKVHKDNEEKTIYQVQIPDLDLEFISKEVYKKEDKEVVFPFRINQFERTRQGKYAIVKQIVFKGLKGNYPSGIATHKSGYGFTKDPSHIIYFIQKNYPNIDKIIISKFDKTQISNDFFIISLKDLERLRKQLSTETGNLRENRKAIITNFFSKIHPAKITSVKPKYKKGTFFNILNNKLNISKNLSPEDKESLYELFKQLKFLEEENFETIITTKKIIDTLLIEDALEEYKKLLNSKRRNEEKWQEFFIKHNWIISQVFSFPAVILNDKAYVGGNRVDNKNSKLTDFLYKNKLTENLAIIEIKTHRAKLLKMKPYRGNDVFKIDDELNGGINQILNQKHNLLKNSPNLREEAEDEENFYVFNPRCLLVIGTIQNLDKKQLKSFELFRNSYPEVHIITFDELHSKLDNLLKIFEKKDKVKKNKKPKSKSKKKKK